MLALSTLCRACDLALPRVAASFLGADVDGVALHRPPSPEEARDLLRLAKKLPVAAVFQAPGAPVGCDLLVIEGTRRGEDPAQSLEDLCRAIHAYEGWRVAVRTPADPDLHPSPAELPLLLDAVAGAGYWHDPARGGAEYLDAAEGRVLGASFHPLRVDDMTGLRDALGGRGVAVVECPPGTGKAEVLEALRAAARFRA